MVWKTGLCTTDIAKNHYTWEVNKQINKFFQCIEDAQLFALYANLGYDSSFLGVFALISFTSTDNFHDKLLDFYHKHNTIMILIGIQLNLLWVYAWIELKIFCHSSVTITNANIATYVESISTFNTTITKLSTQQSQGNATTNQLIEPNQMKQ